MQCELSAFLLSRFSFCLSSSSPSLLLLFFSWYSRFPPSTWTVFAHSSFAMWLLCIHLYVYLCLCVLFHSSFFYRKEFQHDFSFFLTRDHWVFIPFFFSFSLTCLQHFSYRVEIKLKKPCSIQNMQVIKWLYAMGKAFVWLRGWKKLCGQFLLLLFILSFIRRTNASDGIPFWSLLENSDTMSKRIV